MHLIVIQWDTAVGPAQFRMLALRQLGVWSIRKSSMHICGTWWKKYQLIRSASACVLSAVSSCFTLNCPTWPLPSHSIRVLCHHWGLHRWSQTGCNKWIHYAPTKFESLFFLHVACYRFIHLQTWRIEALTIHSKMRILNPLMCDLCMYLHLSWFAFLWLEGNVKARENNLL